MLVNLVFHPRLSLILWNNISQPLLLICTPFLIERSVEEPEGVCITSYRLSQSIATGFSHEWPRPASRWKIYILCNSCCDYWICLLVFIIASFVNIDGRKAIFYPPCSFVSIFLEKVIDIFSLYWRKNKLFFALAVQAHWQSQILIKLGQDILARKSYKSVPLERSRFNTKVKSI